MSKPVIAIAMGDPAGIGPELVLKVLSDPTVFERCRPLVIGDPGVLAENARILKSALHFRSVSDVSGAGLSAQDVDVLCPQGVQVGSIPWGRVDPAMGKVAALCLHEAYKLAMQGAVQGVAAAPMNKQAFHAAGYDFFDELVFLANVTHSTDTYILGATDSFWTVAVAEHVTFTAIPDYIKQERILRRTLSLNSALAGAGYAHPRIAVAALNVHAGEGGLFGREDLDEITPAVQAARRQGIDVQGPLPADTVFVRAREGEFDGVVAMYHDQANIARKLVSTRRGASIYMGLPVIGATTAHGTAFDKAGRGIAEIGSMAAALEWTTKLAAT